MTRISGRFDGCLGTCFLEKFWYNDTQLTLADRKASKHIRKFDTGGKKNMKKRFLSIVLAVLMLLSVLPVTAMAADGTTDTGAEGRRLR